MSAFSELYAFLSEEPHCRLYLVKSFSFLFVIFRSKSVGAFILDRVSLLKLTQGLPKTKIIVNQTEPN